ncbi:MAG TPA: VCBS repeat-containing protein [Urbifossiella sp.]|nr:VCBS repeat-containing protein [Urbifossiella sp.]
MFRLLPALAVALLAAVPLHAADAITWKKTVLDRKFRSEGVAVADVNKDGKIDVLNGEYWYEAPDWTPHEMKPFTDYKDGLRNYSHSFACWADDFNGDGYPDLIVIDFPGDPCFWLENPKGNPKEHWKKHIIWHSACNETPTYVDLLGTGKRVLIMGFQPKGKGNEGQMAYFTPNAKSPNALWDMHPISVPSAPGKEVPGTQKFNHGLGVGDVNGDGRKDVICTGGWWEQPEKADGKTPWAFHPANLGPAAADMFVWDMDGDGKNDVLSTSAHQFGIWWHKQNGSFQRKDIFPKLVSESHAAHFKDIDGDGRPDLITGKRWWSHGRAEPGSDGPAIIYWLRNTKGENGLTKFSPMVIDDDSGIGTQFEVADINGDGLLDIISSNKKGVRVIVQERK